MAALTHIHSQPWLEQMVLVPRASILTPAPTRARTRSSSIPIDPLFARFRYSFETEQGTSARERRRRADVEVPSWLAEQLET
jgi:hypothetical protein